MAYLYLSNTILWLIYICPTQFWGSFSNTISWLNSIHLIQFDGLFIFVQYTFIVNMLLSNTNLWLLFLFLAQQLPYIHNCIAYSFLSYILLWVIFICPKHFCGLFSLVFFNIMAYFHCTRKVLQFPDSPFENGYQLSCTPRIPLVLLSWCFATGNRYSSEGNNRRIYR